MLRFLFTDDDPIHRVDVCDKCKGYIKTINNKETDRKLEPVVEDIATLAFDYTALDQGYKNEMALGRTDFVRREQFQDVIPGRGPLGGL